MFAKLRTCLLSALHLRSIALHVRFMCAACALRVRCVCAVHIPAAHTQAADLATAIASADGKVTAAAVNNMLARERDCMSKGTTKPQGTQPALPGKARGAAIR